jgi:hypothetical protein
LGDNRMVRDRTKKDRTPGWIELGVRSGYPARRQVVEP